MDSKEINGGLNSIVQGTNLGLDFKVNLLYHI